jgi:hypothetical protein
MSNLPENAGSKTVVVCGDLVWDTHVAQLQCSPQYYSQAQKQSQLKTRYGGAWYLRDLIDQAIMAARAGAEEKLRPPEVNVVAPAQPSRAEIEDERTIIGGIAKGFTAWNWYDGVAKPAKISFDKDGKQKYKFKDGDPQPGTWRINDFLGCQNAQWPDDKGANVKACPTIKNPPVNPDVLVIDDLGLGFASNESCWPAGLSGDTPPSHILVKATLPFDNALWAKLLTPKWAKQVTVVVGAHALRDVGARLSRGYSWDRTIEEVKAEFASGGCCWPLRHCRRVVVIFGRSGAAVFSRLPRSSAETAPEPALLQFERLVFDPANLENNWAADLQGTTFGAASAMTAMFAVHSTLEIEPSSHLTSSRGLAGARNLHLFGGGHNEAELNILAGDAAAFVPPPQGKPETIFKSAFPRELLDKTILVSSSDLPGLEDQTLLTDAVGLAPEFLAVAAREIVRHGSDVPLAAVPRLQCGKYFTVDRQEIERLNTVRNLINQYQDSPEDKRPLSIAVFGAPGSGKSFAIKQLAEAMFGKKSANLEFNLSQFEDLSALHEAFHQVRDASVKGQLPFVFWDEFDAARGDVRFGWLKEFLAPMQDAEFVSRGSKHPFGKCIFIFAGGTSATYEKFGEPADASFDPKTPEDKKRAEDFKAIKGPDFISRLRGYVNIKGPNATDAGDTVHIIRRALLLRSFIERHHKNSIRPGGALPISAAVLEAFLGVGDGKPGKGYNHGARSMEAIVSLSQLQGCAQFGPSELPAPEVINLHVSGDFLQIVNDRKRFFLTPADVENLAEKKHNSWWEGKRTSKGYVYGPVRNDKTTPPTHPLCRPYPELSEKDKEGNRSPARLTLLRLEALGYRVVPACVGAFCSAKPVSYEDFEESADLEILAQAEHRRWMREKLLAGMAYGSATHDAILRHKDICKFADLEHPEQQLDRDIIHAVLDFLKEKGLILVRD